MLHEALTSSNTKQSGKTYRQEYYIDIMEYYEPDLFCKHSFIQEVRLWKRQWRADDNKLTSLQPTLQHKDCDPNFFPNIHRVLCQMLLCPVTSAGVERANSSLRYIKNVYRSTMTEDRLNALLFIHRDIKLDYDAIVDMYGNRHPHRMLFVNPLS